jgi:hypothetical protein
MNKAKLKRLKYTWSSDRPSRLSYEKSERQDADKKIRKELVELIGELDYEESKEDTPDDSIP